MKLLQLDEIPHVVHLIHGADEGQQSCRNTNKVSDLFPPVSVGLSDTWITFSLDPSGDTWSPDQQLSVHSTVTKCVCTLLLNPAEEQTS